MQDTRRYLLASASVVVIWAALLGARPAPPSANVVTQTVRPAIPNPPPGNRMAFAQAQAPAGGTTQPCLSLQPGPDWVCQNGTWQLAIAGSTSSGSGTAAPSGGNGAGGFPG